jgi:peptide/nickel transport system substrate-binding protein
MSRGDPARISDSDGDQRPAFSRRRWLELLGMAGVGGLAGCGGGDGEGTDTTAEGTPEPTPTPETLPEVGGTYRSVISTAITTLNVIYNTEATADGLIESAFHGSYGFRPGQVQFPQLFDLTSDDNQVWVATLRENTRWSDPYGDVTAEDFVYTIQELHQSDWAATAAASDWLENDEPIPVTQTGTYEFQIELSNPDPLWNKKPRAWEMRAIPKELAQPYVEEQDAEGLKEDKELLDLSYTGNLGPYDLENWERQSKLTYTRADDYFMRELAEDEDSDVPQAWAKAPYFDRLETQIVTEPSARVGALQTGEADSVGLEPNQAVNLQDTDGIYLNEAPQPYNRPVFYNMRENGWKPFRRPGVRQALGCAVDKERYVRGVQRGYASPEYTWQPPWSPWFTERVQENISRYGTGDLYGPEVTREKMSEALSDTDYGYDGDTLVDGNGEQVELTLLYQTGQDTEQSTAEFIRQEFDQNAGIAVDIEAINPNKFVTDYFRQQQPDNPGELEWSIGPNNYGPRDEVTGKSPWDMGLIYGLNTYPMTPSSAAAFFKRDGLFNAYGYYPSWDAQSTFAQMNEATTVDEYRETVETFFIEVSDDQPMGMLSLGVEITGYNDAVQGPQEEFFNGWDSPTWYKSE